MSNHPQSLSSSSSDNDDGLDILCGISEDERAMHHMIQKNNLIIENYSNELNNQVRHSGFIPGHIVIDRNREAADHNLFIDYFYDNPRFPDPLFHRHYRMPRSLFLRIIDVVKNHDSYFQQRIDGLGRLGLSPLQKITTVFRMLTYGVPADAADEYVKIGESTTIKSLKRFCHAVVHIFAEQYLRTSNANDIARQLHIGEQRGFEGMLGSLDCMHWKWKNCPTAWAGQYVGRYRAPTIILETVTDYDLWIWHAYFGMPSTNNDINVLESSHLFSNLAKGVAPLIHYIIGGKKYNMRYYLANSIYPKWSTIVQTIHEPRTAKKKYFTMKQESCRKDMERAFEVLQSRFAIITRPAHFWQKKVLQDTMIACIIMHNMIIEDERDINAPIAETMEAPTSIVEMATDENIRFEQFCARYKQINNKSAHIELRNALIDHL